MSDTAATLVGVKVSEILRLIGKDGCGPFPPEGEPSPVQAPKQARFGDRLGQAKRRSSPQDKRQYRSEEHTSSDLRGGCGPFPPEGEPSPVQAPKQARFGDRLGQAKRRSSPQDKRQYPEASWIERRQKPG